MKPKFAQQNSLSLPKDVTFSLLLICLSVCLLTKLRKKSWTDFHETW